MKRRYIVLVSIVSLAVLALCLRGAVPEKTYNYSEIPASAVKATIVSYDFANVPGWSVDDFAVDFDNWGKYAQGVNSSLYVNDGILSLNTTFNHELGPQFVMLYRSLDIPVSELPIFTINISVSDGAIYHIRFQGKDAAGVQHEVWWETSPLDDLPGKSEWETHVVDLRSFSEQAVGSAISTVTLVHVILDSPLNDKGDGEKSLRISHIGFSGQHLRVSRIPGDAQYISGEKPFQAVIIDLPDAYKADASWIVQWSSLTYTLTSNSEFEYTMFLMTKDGNPLQEAQGAIFISHEDAFVDIYRLDATPQVTPRSEELTLLQSLLGSSSIVIMKKGFADGGFQTFKLDSIELMTSSEKPQPAIDTEQISYMSIGLVVAVIAVPILLLAIAFRFKDHFTKFPSLFIAALFAYGVICRLALAPFTGHSYDMGVWTQAVRLFYESGVTNMKIFPLPFNCYLLLAAYSPYALLRTMGFQDVAFLAHNFNMLEAVFIKAPYILSDLLSFYFLLKIFNKIDGGKLNSSKFPSALLYFLSPLAIVLSSVWGMYDGIAVALFLAGTYYALFDGKPLRGAVFYALSGLTKAFGFLGLIPIAFTLLREKKYSQFLTMLGIVSAIAILVYLPLLAASGLQSIPESFMQFFRGRIGLGSNSAYTASTSYMSYLSLLGFDVTSPYLTYLLIALVLSVTVCFGLKTRGAKNETNIRLTLGYFVVVLFVFYLLFFRVYEQYYLWIIPILIIYAYIKKESGLLIAALGLSVVVLPTWSFSAFLTGTGYIWIPLSMPADTAIIAILPSAIVALGLISITSSKGPLAILKTWKGMLISASIALWSSSSLAYYACYYVLPLGVAWYFISLVIALVAVVFFYRQLRCEKMNSNVQLSANP